MYTIRMPSGEFLEGKFAITFELNNQIFSSRDTSTLPGTFSFPFDVPLTPNNRRLLEFPDLITNAQNFRSIGNVWIYAEGIALFNGALSIRNATSKKAQVTIVSNPIGALKDAKLTDIDLGGDRSLIPFDHPVYFAGIAENPENYDYILFPAIKTLDSPDTLVSHTDPDSYHNYFTRHSATVDTTNAFALTPFVKLEYLLQKMFELVPGIHFENAWQANTELKRLYIYNNRDMRVSYNNTAPVIPTHINLQQFVPGEKCNEYLKKVAAQFNLGIFTNIFSRKVRIVPLESVLQRPSKWNWTQYLSGDLQVENEFDAPGEYNYPQTETPPEDWPPIENAQVFSTLRDYYESTDGVDDLNKYFYVEDTGKYMKFVYNLTTYYRIHEEYRYHKRVRLSDDDPYEITMESLHPYGLSGYPIFLTPPHTPGTAYYIPDGVSRFEQVTENGSDVWKFQHREYRTALMFYRGIQQVADTLNAEPFACNHVWKPSSWPVERCKIVTGGIEEGDAKYSLNWFGEYGLFNTWHKRWFSMLKVGKPCKALFVMPLSALSEFEFEDKVRVGNMDYFCKRLTVGKLLGYGRVLVEASFISTI